MTKKFLVAASAICLLPLAACGGSPAAENVEAAAENTADMLEANAAEVRMDADNAADAMLGAAENTADAIENKADAVRAEGENKAEAIDGAAH